MSMPPLESVARRVAEFVGDQLGPALRNVAVYDPTEVEAVYVRDDLQDEYRREQFLRLVAAMRDVHREVMRVDAVDSELGAARANVQYFESAFAIQLVVVDDTDIVLAVEREAGRDLAAFVDDCRGLVDEGVEVADVTQ
ncbi:MAG: hypothetical protein ABEJ79_00590 [Halolamina sp.]